MADAEFIEQLRRNLPQLLREHPEVRHELWGMMLEAFPSRQEFMELLQETRAFREDTNQRFQELREDTNQRFQELRQDMDRRFEAVDRRWGSPNSLATLHMKRLAMSSPTFQGAVLC